jgi:hypothetical protein
MKPRYLFASVFAFCATGSLGLTATPSSEGTTTNSPPSAKTEVNKFFNMLHDYHLTLSRASGVSEPAEFGFVDDISVSTEYHANFFLSYSMNSLPATNPVITPSLSVEGHLSSADNKAADAWRFRGGLEFDFKLDPESSKNPVGNGLYLNLNGKYEASRDFNVKKIMAEVEITPTLPVFWMGARASDSLRDQAARRGETISDSQRWVDFRWRPYLDVDAGETIDDGTTSGTSGIVSMEKDSSVFRIRPRVYGELWLNFISEAIALDNVKAFVDYEFAYLPLENTQNTHEYLQTGIAFGFTKHVGFSLTYTVGEQSPDFTHDQSLAGSVTIGF